MSKTIKTITEVKRPDGSVEKIIDLKHDEHLIRPLTPRQKKYAPPRPSPVRSAYPYARIASCWKSKHKLARTNVNDKELSQKEFMKQQAYLISQLDQGEEIPSFDKTKVKPFQVKEVGVEG